MPYSSSTVAARTINSLRCTSTPPLRPPFRIPKLARQLSSRTHASTTHSRNPSHRHPPNHKIAILCGASALAATWLILRQNPERLDAPPPSNRSDASLTSAARVQITGQDHGPHTEKIPTGTSTIPYFPSRIWLPRSGAPSEEEAGKSPALPAGMGAAKEEEEYQLLGLGVRKVSFLRIQVYVVGIYVAKSDVGRLQGELVRASVGSGASTLVQGEKEELKRTLLDGDGSTKVWGEVLKGGGVRSAVRIVPTRDTNFSHMRDGWIRGIDLRGKGEEFADEGFKRAVDLFKGMLGGRGSVGKGKVLLLGRGVDGGLSAWVEGEGGEAGEEMEGRRGGGMAGWRGGGMMSLGSVEDERISRLVWMGYLAGKNTASEDARRSVVDGVLEIVERPLGTVETQVV